MNRFNFLIDFLDISFQIGFSKPHECTNFNLCITFSFLFIHFWVYIFRIK